MTGDRHRQRAVAVAVREQADPGRVMEEGRVRVARGEVVPTRVADLDEIHLEAP